MTNTIYIIEIECYIQGTSTTSLSIGTGSKSFTLAAAITFVEGMTVTADAGGGNTMTGTVTSSSGTSLILDITSTAGSGTQASWTLSGTTTLRYSTGKGFKTSPAESPANTVYTPHVINPGSFEQHIYRDGTTRGRSEVGFGIVVLNNAEHDLDGLIDYGFDGRSLVIRRGDENAAYPSGFTTVFNGTMEQVEFSWNAVTIRLRDRQAEVANTPIQTVKYAGSNSLPDGVEGVADDLEGLPKPLLYGKVENIAPPLVNTSKLTYQIAANQIASIQKVYDKGVEITAGSSHASLALLQAATPTASTYDYYLGASGDGAFFRLGSSPDGVVTCDATQGAASSDRTVAQIVDTILQDHGGVDSGDIDSASITALDTANSNVVGIWIGTQERNIGEVLDEICQSIGAFWVINRSGDFILGRLTAPSGTAAATLESWQVINSGEAVQRLANGDENKGLPAYRVNLEYKKNYTPQADADLAGSVTIVRKNFLKEEYRKVTSTDNSIKTKHLLSPEINITTLLTDATNAQDEADRLLTLYKTRRDMVQVRVISEYAEDLSLNDVVSLDLERFTWSGGKLFRVLGITEDFSVNRTILRLWG